MTSRISKKDWDPAVVNSTVEKKNELTPNLPTQTTATEFKARQRAAGQSTQTRIQGTVLKKGEESSSTSQGRLQVSSEESSAPGIHAGEVALSGDAAAVTQSVPGDAEDAGAKYLAANTVEQMKKRVRAISDNPYDEQLEKLAGILVNAPAAVQQQVVANFVAALAPETSEETGPVLSVISLRQLITHLKQGLAAEPAASSNNSTGSIARISLGILDGVALVPGMDVKPLAPLLRAVAAWCSDPASMPDNHIAEVSAKACSIMHARAADVPGLLECIESVCFLRMRDADFDNIPDKDLPDLTKQLRRRAKWFLDDKSPGYGLNKMFNRLIDRIDERDPSIGAIPEIVHEVWLGKPISKEHIEKLVDFLRLNPNCEGIIIGTDRPQETQLVIDRVSENNSEYKSLLAKVTPCHYIDWLPAENEMIGSISGAEIRTLVETLRSGPGRLYPGASDFLRCLGICREKQVNGETKKGGLYFDTDLSWHKPLPRLSSPLGITLNYRSAGLNNNFLGFPTDIEVAVRLIEAMVYAYRERDLETALEHVEEYFPNVAEDIKRMNSEYEQRRIENPLLEPTEHDPKFEFNPETTEEEKQEIRKQRLTRAREIMAQFHPAQNKLDYSRFRYAIDDTDDNHIRNSRHALTMVLTGPARLDWVLTNMFGKDYHTHEPFTRLGALGGFHTDEVRTDQVFTEISDGNWARTPPGRRASVGGTTTLGELENPPTNPLGQTAGANSAASSSD